MGHTGTGPYGSSNDRRDPIGIPTENKITAELASQLYGWAGDPEKVLQAIISTLIGDEVNCLIEGDNNQHVAVIMYNADMIDKADDIIKFLMAMRDINDDHPFATVKLHVHCYKSAIFDEFHRSESQSL